MELNKLIPYFQNPLTIIGVLLCIIFIVLTKISSRHLSELIRQNMLFIKTVIIIIIFACIVAQIITYSTRNLNIPFPEQAKSDSSASLKDTTVFKHEPPKRVTVKNGNSYDIHIETVKGDVVNGDKNVRK